MVIILMISMTATYLTDSLVFMGIVPAVVMACTGAICGVIVVHRHGGEFLLTRAVPRKRLFAADMCLAVVIASLVLAALVFPGFAWLVIELGLRHLTLLAVNSLLVFIISWLLGVFLYSRRNDKTFRQAVACVLCAICGTFVGAIAAVLFGLLLYDAATSIISCVILCGVMIIVAKPTLAAYCQAEPGGWLPGRMRAKQTRAAGFVHAEHVTTGAARPYITVPTVGSQPGKARYLRPLLWFEVVGWTRNPLRLVTMVVFGYLIGFSGTMTLPIFLVMLCLGSTVRMHRFLDVRRPLPLEFHLTLALRRKLCFAVRMASGLFLLLALVALFAFVFSLSGPQDISSPLPHRAAQAVNADHSEDILDWFDALANGFLLVPQRAYSVYDVRDGGSARVLGRTCLVVILYFLFWLSLTPSATRSKKIGLDAATSGRGLALRITFCLLCYFGMGPVDAWVFVLACMHPLYLIGATVAICLLLLRVAEQQFVNLEVGR